MKVQVLSTKWQWAMDPMRLRCSLDFGQVAGKHAEAFLPIHPNTPAGQPYFQIVVDGRIFFSGRDEKKASAKLEEDNAVRHHREDVLYPEKETHIDHLSFPSDDLFIVAKTKAGTVLVMRGKDKTNRCLLFVGVDGPQRSTVEVFKDATTGQILASCQAYNEMKSAAEAVVILGEGDTIAFRVRSEHLQKDELRIFTWKSDIGAFEKESITFVEWDYQRRIAAEVAEGVSTL